MSTALVVSGGGSKGAFAVGVIKQLLADQPGLQFDIFVGTSTGSLIVPLVAASRLDILETIYTTVTTTDIITKGNVIDQVLNSSSIYDATPLANLIAANLPDTLCQQLLQMPAGLFFATTCLQTGQSVNFSNQAPPAGVSLVVNKLTTPDELRHAVLASACQPVFMQPIEVPPGANPVRQYVDGGVKEYAGLQLALEAGADTVYAIVLTPQDSPPVEQTFNNVFPILEQTIDIFTGGVGTDNLLIPLLFNQGLRYISDVQQMMLQGGISQAQIDNFFDTPSAGPFKGRKPAKIYVIRPLQTLNAGPGGLDFDPANMQNMLAMGQARLTQYIASLPPNGDQLT